MRHTKLFRAQTLPLQPPMVSNLFLFLDLLPSDNISGFTATSTKSVYIEASMMATLGGASTEDTDADHARGAGRDRTASAPPLEDAGAPLLSRLHYLFRLALPAMTGAGANYLFEKQRALGLAMDSEHTATHCNALQCTAMHCNSISLKHTHVCFS